ncbi:MAG: zincin-like metallopeptidase domain-containing protein [Prevotella sp.]
MKEKSPQEEKAAIRQVQLINEALTGAKERDGQWLNHAGMMAPRIYPKGPMVSPFNALVLQLNADRENYPSSQYVFFHTAKAAGIPVVGKEKGTPFNWYAWDMYVNKHDPKDIITAGDYKKLPSEQQAEYKGVQQRQIRMLFNLDQTVMPHAEEDKYRTVLDRFGSANERGNLKSEERQLRASVNNFVKQMKDYLVPVRREASESAHYDTEKDAVYMPDQKKYAEYPEYVQELLRQIISATGHQQRLAREGMVMKGGHAPGDYADRYERLVVEVASAVKMNELGLPAKISPQNITLIDSWTRELQENPCMIDALEADLNNALDVIRKAEQGEKIEYARFRTKAQIDELQQKQKPQVDSREAVILCDILRHGGMKIDDRNFSSPEEKREFLEKFDLTYYNKGLEEAMALTVINNKDEMNDQQLRDAKEQVELAYGEALKNADSINRLCSEYLPDVWNSKSNHYLIHDMIRQIPNEIDRSMVVVKDSKSGVYDVMLPSGAMAGGYVNLPNGERKLFRVSPDEVMSQEERANANATLTNFALKGFPLARIEAALKRDGAKYVRLYNNDGRLSFNADDGFYEGKTVHEMSYRGDKLSEVARLDVSGAVEAANSVLFDRVQMLKDDNARWAFFIKPKDGDSFCIYPEKEDVNRFFSTLRQGHQSEADRLRMELGQKYYELVKTIPSLRFNIFNDIPEGVDVSRITRVNVYKTKEDKIMCAPKIEGADNVKPREISRDQWNRMFVAEDMAEYKTSLAAKVFADVLGAGVSRSEAQASEVVKPEPKVESVEVEKTEEVEETQSVRMRR